MNPHSSRGAVLWETIPACKHAQLERQERGQFKQLQELSKTEQKEWVNNVLVLERGKGEDSRHHFYDKSFKVLGGLTDNLYVKTEILVYWMKQLGKENAVYLETMTGLKFDKNCSEVKQSDALSYIEKRLRETDAVDSGVVVYFQQHVPRTHDHAQQRLLKVISFLDSGNFPRWVGGNIVGPEHDDRGSLDLLVTPKISAHLSACKSCRWSVHAGELRCKNWNVLDAIEKFNASRIGHGLNWLDDGNIMEETLKRVRTRDILIETNLVSNKALDILGAKEHPLLRFLQHHISTCLCTDDSAMWGSTLTDEYMLAATLIPSEKLFDAFFQMGFDSLKYSFAPEDEKHILLDQYQNRINEFSQSCLGNLNETSAEDCYQTPNSISKFACAEWEGLCPNKQMQPNIWDMIWCALYVRGLGRGFLRPDRLFDMSLFYFYVMYRIFGWNFIWDSLVRHAILITFVISSVAYLLGGR